MIFEIWCNGKLHYTRPAGHPDLAECLELIERTQRLFGVSAYEIRPTKHAPDVVESAASVSISPASEVSAPEAVSTPATTQVM